MDLEELTPQQKRDFAVDCFDRVYPLMSHRDPTGEFRKAVDTARTPGDHPEARKFCRTFVRTLSKASPSASIMAAAKAGRECLQNNPGVVASLAAEATSNPYESAWQASRLHDMLSGELNDTGTPRAWCVVYEFHYECEKGHETIVKQDMEDKPLISCPLLVGATDAGQQFCCAPCHRIYEIPRF